MSARILNADCLAALRDMPAASVDAVVTDPPYGLSNTTPAQVADTITRWVSGDREYLPSARGFMGHEWDGFVPPVAVWDECLRVLKPGGHLLAFAGSRTHDLMTLGIRLAGFEIRDSVAWLYGSGFPKSMDVSKAIDSTGGVSAADQARVLRAARERADMTREEVAAVVGCTVSSVRDWEEGRARAVGRATEFITPSPAYRSKLADVLGYTEDERVIVGVASPTGAIWGNGTGRKEYAGPATDAARQWEGWGTALKPAFEPVTLARKPLSGTVAANVQEHGTGALNIDACRIGTDPAPGQNGRTTGVFMFDGFTTLADLEAAAEKGERTPKGRDARATLACYRSARIAPTATGKTGRWPANVVLDESQAAELDRQSGVTASAQRIGRRAGKADTTSYGAFSGQERALKDHGDSGGASRFFYVAKAPKSERPVVDGTAHPTVKPIALMRWLVRMVTPPNGTVLDPFAGSGTTLEAAMLEGFNVTGVEREADYLPLIQARIDRATTALAAQAEADADTLFPIDGAAS